ncbi:MAG: electron transfer flavoprotein subunit alpha/FixB family protein [Solirubrobacterales bacterium]
MAAILVYSAKQDLGIELLSKAKEIAAAKGLEVAAAAFGSMDAGLYAARGAKVFTAANPELASLDASVLADALAQIAGKADAKVILVDSSRRGKELAARLAQKLDAACITDVNVIDIKDDGLTCARNAFGGATVAVQSAKTAVQVIAVMPHSFEAAAAVGSGTTVAVELALKPGRLKVTEVKDKNQGTVDLEGADVLVCVGKGLSSQADLKIAEDLAAALGGLVACSKPVATDQKWMPEDRIIGLSGKKAKPQIAICLGISGQVQFTVGIRDAKCIVAVNSDQNAYIFQMADYGIVGDLHQIVPALTAALK